MNISALKCVFRFCKQLKAFIIWVFIVACIGVIMYFLITNCVDTVMDEWFPKYQQKINKRQFELHSDKYGKCIKCGKYFPHKIMSDDGHGNWTCDSHYIYGDKHIEVNGNGRILERHESLAFSG